MLSAPTLADVCRLSAGGLAVSTGDGRQGCARRGRRMPATSPHCASHGVQPIALRSMFRPVRTRRPRSRWPARCAGRTTVPRRAGPRRSARHAPRSPSGANVWLPSVGRLGAQVRHELSALRQGVQGASGGRGGLDSGGRPLRGVPQYGQCVRTEYQDLMPVSLAVDEDVDDRVVAPAVAGHVLDTGGTQDFGVDPATPLTYEPGE